MLRQFAWVWKPRIRLVISVIMLLSNAAVPFLRNEPVSNSACAQTGSDWTIRQLTINGGSWPAVSGDGSKVAFISRAYTKSVVSVINSDGTGFKQLTNLESRFPSISGDGSKIVFSAIYNETSFGLCIIDSDGSGLRELVHLRNTAFSSISYDGSKIAFMVYLNPMELYVINSDGTGLRQLASGMLLYAPGENARSIITANGSKIVFYAFVDSNSDSKPDSLDIYTVNSDGTGLNRLTTGLHATYPSISNDGRRIAFREGESIYIMNSDGTGLTQISSAGEWPSISGDGSTVAVQGRMNGSITIFTVSIDGGSVKQIVNTGTNLYPAVNYDGSRIVFLSSFGGLYGDAYQVAIAFSPESNPAPRTWTVAADGSGDYLRIQSAVNAATSGDIIHVLNGVYPETVIVAKNKLTIRGDSSSLTVVGGFQLRCNYTVITGFKMVGLHRLDPSNYSSTGVEFIGAFYNTVKWNAITDCGTGLSLLYHTYGNPSYVIPESCRYNLIAENNIIGNDYAIFFNLGYTNNTFYHNNFINNTVDIDYIHGYSENWDNGYPSGGNYWDRCIGLDLMSGLNQNESGSDGIIDTPYVIDSYFDAMNQTDHYPLINPWGSIITVPDDYSTIQEAVDHTFGKRIIIVREGIYTENININKDHLTIVSEQGSTIQAAHGLNAITITASFVNMTGFRIKHANNTGMSGIRLENVHDCSIVNNNLTGNYYGINLISSQNNTIVYNTVSLNNQGLSLVSSRFNLFKNNTIQQNKVGFRFQDADSNIIYHNAFTNNTQQIVIVNSTNTWDDGESGGNNWSDYTGYDADYDGKGEPAYIIDAVNVDNYPLTMRHSIPPAPKSFSLIINLGSPATFFITDPLGRSFGVDPKTGQNLTQIPDASCSGSSSRIIVINNPSNGTYNIQIYATTTGSYTLSIELSTPSGNSVKNYTGQISTGETQLHIADISGNTLMMRQLESFPWMLYTGLTALVVTAGIILLMIYRQRSQRSFQISGDESETVVY